MGDIAECCREDGKEKEELVNLSLEINEEFEQASNFIMIDFDSSEDGYKEILHPCSHMHIGARHEFRMAINKFPIFSEFVDFILFFYYRTKWLEFNLELQSEDEFNNLIFQDYLKKKLEVSKSNTITNKFSELETRHFYMSF